MAKGKKKKSGKSKKSKKKLMIAKKKSDLHSRKSTRHNRVETMGQAYLGEKASKNVSTSDSATGRRRNASIGKN